MNWYYAENGQQNGPVTEADLDALFHQRKIQADTLVWGEGMANWQTYNQARLGGGGAPALPPLTVGGTAALPGTLGYAGFWVRFAAILLDGLILSGVKVMITLASGVSVGRGFGIESGAFGAREIILAIIQLGIGVGYEVFMIGRYGGTLGKMALHLRVVTPNGGPVSYARALGRYFAKILSSLICLIGFIMAAFDSEKRTLHDRICDTRVIRT